jgi:hypothetical protein
MRNGGVTGTRRGAIGLSPYSCKWTGYRHPQRGLELLSCQPARRIPRRLPAVPRAPTLRASAEQGYLIPRRRALRYAWLHPQSNDSHDVPFPPHPMQHARGWGILVAAHIHFHRVCRCGNLPPRSTGAGGRASENQLGRLGWTRHRSPPERLGNPPRFPETPLFGPGCVYCNVIGVSRCQSPTLTTYLGCPLAFRLAASKTLSASLLAALQHSRSTESNGVSDGLR